MEKIKTKLEYYRRFLIVKKGNNVSKFMSYKETLSWWYILFPCLSWKKEVLQKSLFLLRNIFSRHSVKLFDKLEVKLEIFC